MRRGNKKISVGILDDGLELPEDVKDIFSGGKYTGETAGVGGVRYYMIREIAEHNDAEIEIRDFELGWSKIRHPLRENLIILSLFMMD